MISVGDGLSLIVSLLYFLGIFAVVYFLIRKLIRSSMPKQNSNSEHIEQKLDRIIDLLEKDKKE